MNNRYMSNNIERNATWRVGVYCRLSKDDELTGEISMQKWESLNSISKKERTVYLNISFTKGTGNLKIEVPAVPG